MFSGFAEIKNATYVEECSGVVEMYTVGDMEE